MPEGARRSRDWFHVRLSDSRRAARLSPVGCCSEGRGATAAKADGGMTVLPCGLTAAEGATTVGAKSTLLCHRPCTHGNA